MRRPVIIVSVLAGILVLATDASAAPPNKPVTGPGGIGIRLVDVGVDSRNPLARSYIVARIPPGTSIHRRIEITNTTGSTAAVAVYPAAANLRRSTFGFAPAHRGNELSSWTSVSHEALRLASGAKTVETVTVNVPKEASPGERYAVIWAEISALAPAEGGVTLVNRVGIRMYLAIGPGGASPANFVIGVLSAKRSASGVPLVTSTIRNSGRRTLDIAGSLTLSRGPGRLRAGPFGAKLRTALAPGDAQAVTVRLDERLPRGPWHARLRLSGGRIERTAVATITFPRRAESARRPTATAVPAGHRMLLAVVITLLVSLSVGASAFLLSRRAASRM